MRELVARRLRPFGVAIAILVIVCIAVARLPDSLVELLDRKSPFSSGQLGWAYRLLVLAAVGQALYGGFVLLRPDHVQKARAKDQKLAQMSRAKLTGIVARTAASMTVFTLLYGIAAFLIGGQRGGFWLFPLLAIAQGAWYYRQVGQIAKWMGFQPEAKVHAPGRGAFEREPADYCPPLVRGLKPLVPADKEH